MVPRSNERGQVMRMPFGEELKSRIEILNINVRKRVPLRRSFAELQTGNRYVKSPPLVRTPHLIVDALHHRLRRRDPRFYRSSSAE